LSPQFASSSDHNQRDRNFSGAFTIPAKWLYLAVQPFLLLSH
jgi:hypothetical protein